MTILVLLVLLRSHLTECDNILITMHAMHKGVSKHYFNLHMRVGPFVQECKCAPDASVSVNIIPEFRLSSDKDQPQSSSEPFRHVVGSMDTCSHLESDFAICQVRKPSHTSYNKRGGMSDTSQMCRRTVWG